MMNKPKAAVGSLGLLALVVLLLALALALALAFMAGLALLLVAIKFEASRYTDHAQFEERTQAAVTLKNFEAAEAAEATPSRVGMSLMLRGYSFDISCMQLALSAPTAGHSMLCPA